VDVTKKRWENIRDSYSRNKRKPSTGSAASIKKKWTLAPHLGFLEQVECERRYLHLHYNVIYFNAYFIKLNHNIMRVMSKKLSYHKLIYFQFAYIFQLIFLEFSVSDGIKCTYVFVFIYSLN